MAEALQISEFLAVNEDSLTTRTRSTPSASFRGERAHPDWIELQNVSDEPVEVGGLFLTDDPRVPWKWQVPAPTTLAAHEFLVVFASGLDIRDARLDENQKFHTNFKLDANGDYLALMDDEGEVLHEIADPSQQEADVSYGLGSDGQAHYLTQLTPGQPNAEPYLGAVADTQFSVDRGYFEQPFAVEISSATEDAEIRYTLDGSPPTATAGTVYAGPIQIDTTTNLRAAAFKTGYLSTDVDTHTYIFVQDVIHQPARISGFPYGGSTWAGQNAYVPQDSEMDPEVVDDPAYREMIDDALLAIPTMSITSDPGQIFSEQGWYDGEDIEKSVSVEILYPDDAASSHQVDAGIESHSHDRLKRSLRLNFREIYGSTSFQSDLFARDPVSGDSVADQFNSIVLRGGNNRSWARIWNPDKTAYTIDEFYRTSQVAMSGYGMRGTFTHLYINGVYWGLYNPVERADAEFHATYFGGEADDWFALNQGGDLSGDDDRYDYLANRLTRADLSLAEKYDELQQYLDVESFIDYLIISWWTAVSDWPQNNHYGGNRNETSTDGPTPFRYVAWDGEWSWGQGGQSSSNGRAHVHADFRASRSGGAPIARIWHAARENDDFMTLFYDRVYRHLFHDGALTEQNAKDRWMALNDFVRDAVVAESARWGDSMESEGHRTRTRDVDWQRQVDRILDLMTGNNDYFLRALRREGFYPELDAPEVSQHGGTVAVGDHLTIDNPNDDGVVYYTTDGSDPRLSGGAISPEARVMGDGDSITVDGSFALQTRTYDDGQWSALQTVNFAVDWATPLLVTELMFNPPAPDLAEVAAGYLDNDDFEFIEILNRGPTSLPLAGYEVTEGVTFSFAGEELAAGERAVVVSNEGAFRLRYGDQVRVLGQYETSRLANDGESLAISDPLGRTILSLQYDDNSLWPQGADGVGAALELTDPLTISLDVLSKPVSWQTSVRFGGTPGDAAVPRPPVVVNEVLSASSQVGLLDQIELFNPSSQTVDIGGWYLSDSAREPRKYRIPDDTQLGPGQYVVFDERHFNADPTENDSTSFALSRFGDDVWLSLFEGEADRDRMFVDDVHFPAAEESVPFARVPDGAGRLVPVSSSTFGEPNAEPRLGSVVISELNYHPEMPSAAALAIEPDMKPEDLEFVEIYNPTSSSIDLTHWRIRSGVDFEFPPGTQLDARSALLVVPFDTTRPESALRGEAFRAHYDLDPSTTMLGNYRGRLSDSMDRVRLLRGISVGADDVVHVSEDEVVYDDREPWPTEADGGGASLQRLSPQAYGNAAESWQGNLPTPGRMQTPPGDFDADGSVTAADIDLFCQGLAAQDRRFDLNADDHVDQIDYRHLVEVILGTTWGDANLDGVFNSSDLVQVFVAGQYEDGVPQNSGWAQGDWTCDGEFTSSDLVTAFQGGGYSYAAVAHDLSAAAAELEARRDSPIAPSQPRSPRMTRVSPGRAQRAGVRLREPDIIRSRFIRADVPGVDRPEDPQASDDDLD